jgi:hypothetical protein
LKNKKEIIDMDNMKKDKIIIILISALSILISLFVNIKIINAEVYLPINCSDTQIKATWDSIFKESSSGITIYTNNTVINGQCSNYFARKIDGEIIHYLVGAFSESLDYTAIQSLYGNCTSDYINIISGISNINEINQIPFFNSTFLDKYVNPRESIISEEEAEVEYLSIYKETPSTWNSREVYGTIDYEFNISFQNNTLNKIYLNSVNNNYTFNRIIYTYITYSPSCKENWSCEWIPFICPKNRTQTPINCRDNNACNTTKNLPLNRTCRYLNTSALCTPDWNCTSWSDCTSNIQIRSCVDFNGCGDNSTKPSETQSCGTTCLSHWNCTEWSPETCPKSGLQSRNCTDVNNCSSIASQPEEEKSCTYKSDFGLALEIITVVIIFMTIGTAIILFTLIKKRFKNY